MSVMTRSGSGGGAQLDQLAAVLGHGDDLVAQKRQDLLEVVAHVELVVGDGDLERTGHESPRGKVMRKTAPGPSPSPTAIWPPWASTIRLAMAMPRPVPLALVVKNGSKIFDRCSGRDPRAVVAHGDAERGLAVELDRRGTDLDRDGSRAGGQGVVQDIAEDLLEAERVRRRSAGPRHRAISRSTACLSLRAGSR